LNEILVIDGVFDDEHGTYPKGSWLRSPHLSAHNPFTGPDGALIYVKTGHLAAPASVLEPPNRRFKSQRQPTGLMIRKLKETEGSKSISRMVERRISV
jgi:hypothetical protein